MTHESFHGSSNGQPKPGQNPSPESGTSKRDRIRARAKRMWENSTGAGGKKKIGKAEQIEIIFRYAEPDEQGNYEGPNRNYDAVPEEVTRDARIKRRTANQSDIMAGIVLTPIAALAIGGIVTALSGMEDDSQASTDTPPAEIVPQPDTLEAVSCDMTGFSKKNYTCTFPDGTTLRGYIADSHSSDNASVSAFSDGGPRFLRGGEDKLKLRDGGSTSLEVEDTETGQATHRITVYDSQNGGDGPYTVTATPQG